MSSHATQTARELTASGLLSALHGVAGTIGKAPAAPRRDVIGEWLAEMPKRVAAAYDATIEHGASLLVAEPHRIPRAVYGLGAAMEWPTTKTTVAVLADCREFIRSETDRGRDGYYTFDMHRLTALRQAESALVKLLGGV
jgi:hypothetical protein